MKKMGKAVDLIPRDLVEAVNSLIWRTCTGRSSVIPQNLDDPRWPFKNRNMLPDVGEEAQSMAQMIEEFMPRHDLPDAIKRELHPSRDDKS